MDESPYAVALLDWLACAVAGASSRAATAMRAAGDGLVADVAFAGTAGHVLDFDDTLSDGVAHVSAACAPAALVVAASVGATLGDALAAYTRGFEAMGAVAAASHPALYDAGWHPTAVCGPIGAVVTACELLGVSGPRRESALALAMLRAGGSRGAFGSDGKAIQVGLAAAAGVQAAVLARAGAVVDPRAIDGPVGWAAVTGATWVSVDRPGAGSGARAIDRNWIKLYPSCLGTHSPIDAALGALGAGADGIAGREVVVRVDTVGRQAAHLDAATDGLAAKFSIPYCVAHALVRGAPGVADFDALDPEVAAAARGVRVEVDGGLPQWGAALCVDGVQVARVDSPRGSPERPARPEDLRDKLASLAGDRLDGLLDDLDRPAADALLWSRR
jgi:2-methylcitrate dehydratase PrpD